MSSKKSHHSDEVIEDVEKAASLPPLDISPKQESRLLYVSWVDLLFSSFQLTIQRRKIDWRMLPLLGLLYSVSLIDRTNLGIARTAGMAKDLVMLYRDLVQG
jgi:hypothetical protein